MMETPHVKSLGLLQRRVGLDAAGFRDHYETRHVPLARRLLGFPGYQRNYPTRDEDRARLGFDGFSEFWFRGEAETARIGEIMQGPDGALMLEDEPRFMDVPRNQTHEVEERQFGSRPMPGATFRAIAVERRKSPTEATPEWGFEELDWRREERANPGVLTALYSRPLRSVTPVPAGQNALAFAESLWLEDALTLEHCNQQRSQRDQPLLVLVEESGTPVLDFPY